MSIAAIVIFSTIPTLTAPWEIKFVKIIKTVNNIIWWTAVKIGKIWKVDLFDVWFLNFGHNAHFQLSESCKVLNNTELYDIWCGYQIKTYQCIFLMYNSPKTSVKTPHHFFRDTLYANWPFWVSNQSGKIWVIELDCYLCDAARTSWSILK